MFFKTAAPEPGHDSELRDVVEQALPDADPDTRRVVVAVAGLLGCASYADRNFSPSERRRVGSLLQTIHGVGADQAESILEVLQKSVVQISTVEAPRHARTLLELGDRDLRFCVLDLLLQVAASDQNIRQDEVVFLRQMAKSLGLDQSDYNQLQSKHKHMLAVLK